MTKHSGKPGSVRRVVLAALVAVTLLASMVTAAPALAETPKPTPPAVGQRVDPAVRTQRVEERLEKAFKLEQGVLAKQQKTLDQVNQRVSKFQQTIADLKAKGKDTTKLEAALSGFQTSIGQARAGYDTAKALIDKHDGFDASGNVVDAKLAAATVKEAGKAQRQFHLTIRQARVALAKAVREFRKENQGQTPVSMSDSELLDDSLTV